MRPFHDDRRSLRASFVEHVGGLGRRYMSNKIPAIKAEIDRLNTRAGADAGEMEVWVRWSPLPEPGARCWCDCWRVRESELFHPMFAAAMSKPIPANPPPMACNSHHIVRVS